MADSDIDRSEAATPFKLQKAREQAQTARSLDAVAAAVFASGVAWLAWQGEASAAALLRLFHAALVQVAAVDASGHGIGTLAGQLVGGAAGILAPLLVALPLAALVASVAQTGMVFSPGALHVDFQRINPATGLRRVFSPRTLFDGLRACAKLVVLGLAGGMALTGVRAQFAVLATLPPASFLHAALSDLASLGWRMAAALAVIAAADMVFTGREFSRKMRMSRRELKEEFRQREGDPRIRSRMRELRRELMQRSRSLRNTRDADVVLTNPTHFAVALHYVHGKMDAPRIVAKGAGQLAAAMRDIAARHGIVVVQNPPLARRLFREAGLDDYLPESFHAEVARIFVWVLAMRQQRAAADGVRR